MSLTCQDSRANSDTPYFLPIQTEGSFSNHYLGPADIPLYITDGTFGVGNQEPVPDWYFQVRLRLEPSNSANNPFLREAQIGLNRLSGDITNKCQLNFDMWEDNRYPSVIYFFTDLISPLGMSCNNVRPTVPLIVTNNVNGSGGTSAQIVIQDLSFTGGFLDFENPSNTYRFCNSNNGNLYLGWASNPQSNMNNFVTFDGNGGAPLVSICNISVSSGSITNLNVGTLLVEANTTMFGSLFFIGQSNGNYGSMNDQLIEFSNNSNIWHISNSNNGTFGFDWYNPNTNYTNFMNFTAPSNIPTVTISNLTAGNITVTSNLNLNSSITIGTTPPNQTIISNNTITTGSILASSIIGGYNVQSNGNGYWLVIGNMLMQWGTAFNISGWGATFTVNLPVSYLNAGYSVTMTPSTSFSGATYTTRFYNKNTNSFSVQIGADNQVQYVDWQTMGLAILPPSIPTTPTFSSITSNSAIATCTNPSQLGATPLTYTLTYNGSNIAMTQSSVPTTYTVNLSNLTPATVYNCTVTVSNSIGSNISSSSQFSTSNPSLPSAPPRYSLVSETSTGYTLNFNDSNQIGLPPYSYVGYWASSNGGSENGSQALSNTSGTTYEFDNQGLVTKTRFNFYSTVSNVVGISPSSLVYVGFTSLAFNKPSAPTLVSVNNNNISLTWNIAGLSNAGNNPYIVNLVYDTNPFPSTLWTSNITINGSIYSSIVSGLTPSTTYYFEVMATQLNDTTLKTYSDYLAVTTTA